MLKRFLCSMCCLWAVTCLVLNYPEPVMGPPKNSWFLGHVHAGEGRGLLPLNSPLGRKATWTHILGRKENYPSRKVAAAWHFLAMSVRGEVLSCWGEVVKLLWWRERPILNLQQRNCSSSAQLLMPSKLKSKINKNIFAAIHDKKSRPSLLVLWNS